MLEIPQKLIRKNFVLESNQLDIEQDVKKIISKIIEAEPEKIGLDTYFVEELGADSMMALEIMAALEKKYNITRKNFCNLYGWCFERVRTPSKPSQAP